MGDVHQEGLSGGAVRSTLVSAVRAADQVDASVTPTVVKGVLGVSSLVSLLFGVRSAWKHSRHPEAAELLRPQVVSGVGFAARALAVATVITVSGFSLIVVGVSAILNVNSPRQFGAAMRQAFGDSVRLPQSQNSVSFEELIQSIEAEKASKAESSAKQSA